MSDSQEERFIFSAKLDTVGTVATLLKSIAFCEKVNIFLSNSGLKFTVEEGKYIQAYVLMQRDLFQEYTLNEEEASFKIPLKELLECLKIFCSDGKISDSSIDSLTNTSLTLLYRDLGSPFEFVLEENGIITDFKLKTEETDDLMEFDIDPPQCKIVLKADLFMDLLGEVDSNNPEIVQISVIPMEQLMILRAKGVSGLMEVVIPATSAVVDFFDCNGDEECTSKFRLHTLKYAFKAIQIGEKVVLKMNSEGILSLSFLITSKSDSFVEFFVIPLQGVEAEDDDEEEV